MSIDRYIDALKLSPAPAPRLQLSKGEAQAVPAHTRGWMSKRQNELFREQRVVLHTRSAISIRQNKPFRERQAVSYTRGGTGAADNGSAPLRALPNTVTAAVNTNALLSFVAGVSPLERDDVLYSVQLAARGASGRFDCFTQTQSWYQKYTEILQYLGWTMQQFAFVRHNQGQGQLRMDQEALAVIAAIATQNQLAVLNEAIGALEKLAANNGTIRLFDINTSTQTSGNFQIGAVQRADNGALSLALGAFHFRSLNTRRRFLFFAWGAQQVQFWTAAQKMTFNTNFYAQYRDMVRQKLGAHARAYIGALKL